MTVSDNPVAGLSDLTTATTALVERIAPSIVSVHGGNRRSSSGIHWRPGVVVTAEEALEHDEDIKVTLPGGHQVEAALVGRDPTTDVAVLRFQAEALPVAKTANGSPRAGHLIMSIGAYEGAPLAALGIVAFAGGAWRSARGGAIDTLIRLDVMLSPAAEGAALVDVQGQVIGMTVLGPRGRALAIPTSTIDRSVEQLLARGRVFRGYLGARFQPVRHGSESQGSQSSGSGRGVLVVSIDPDGPSAHAGILVGDIVTTWNGTPIGRVREIIGLLGPESIGSSVDLGLRRGGAPTTCKVVIGERPIS